MKNREELQRIRKVSENIGKCGITEAIRREKVSSRRWLPTAWNATDTQRKN
jgi:hypothetical protein